MKANSCYSEWVCVGDDEENNNLSIRDGEGEDYLYTVASQRC